MPILLFILYVIFFTWLVTRTAFFRKAGLSARHLAGLFLLHVAVGVLYGYVHTFPPQYLQTIDTWRFHQEGLMELEKLKSDPLTFFGELFHDPYHSGFRRLFSTQGSYWNDLKNNVMVKMDALFDLFSLGQYYTNLIFYAYLSLFGPIALVRVYNSMFPEKEKIVLIAVMLTPSILFWGSGFHKEALLLVAIGMAVFQWNRIKNGQHSLIAWAGLACSFAAIFILRNNVLFALLPPFVSLWIAALRKARAWSVFLLVNLVSMVLFFVTPKFFPKLDPPMTMSLRQKSFIALGGRTALPMDELQPNFSGFLHNLPSAANISFLHPLPGEGGLFYIPFTAELLLLFLSLLLAAVYPDRRMWGKPLILFALNFAILLFLLIGYCVPNVGAIIRYRSPGMPFLFLACWLATDWQKLRIRFQYNTN